MVAGSTSAQAWYSWCADSTTASTSSSNNGIWYAWTAGTTATTSATTNTNVVVWRAWSSADAAPTVVREYRYTPPPETDEQRQARQQREEQARIQAEENRRKEAEALQRAEDFLMMHLNAQQLKDWQREQFFDVMSQSGKRFRIKNKYSMNVEEFDNTGKVVVKHCIIPKDRVPLPDQFVMQKMMLELNEADFMRIANHSRVN